MSGVFQNIDPPTPSPPGECVPPAFGGGEDTLAGWRGGWGFNILEDARHCSVLYIRKYFVGPVHIHSGRYYSRPVLHIALTRHFALCKILGCKLKGMLPFIDSYYTQITSYFPLLLQPAPKKKWLQEGI
jgi:hypothetical protein